MSKYCGLCDENLGEAMWESHNKSWPHLRNAQQREHAILLEIDDNWHGITQNDIILLFSSFGPITKLNVHTKLVPAIGYAYMEFSNSAVVTRIVTQTYYMLKGHLVKVSRWVTDKQRNSGYELEEKELVLGREKEKQFLKDICTSVRLVVKTEQQVNQLVWMQELPSNDKKFGDDLRTNIEEAIQKYIPEAYVSLIGSYANGLATRGCDLNMQVCFNKDKPYRKNFKKVPEMSAFFLKQTGFRTESGLVTFSSFAGDEKGLQRYWFIYEILAKSPLSLNMGRMKLIQSAENRRISFRHLGNQIDCDVRFELGKSLPVQKARLIKLLVSLDPRVRPVYLTIKFWAKQVGVFAVFDSLGLFLLVYFYLQSCKPPLLPSLETLSDMGSAKEKLTIGSFEAGFCKSVATIQEQCLASKNTQTSSELLQGFFRFYAKFELANRVFLPRTGRSYNMLKFRNMKKIVPHLAKFNVVDPIFYIQDVFELDRNVITEIDLMTKHRVCLEFLRAATIVQDFAVDSSSDLLSLFPLKSIKPDMESLLQRAPIVIPFDASLLPEGFLTYDSYTMAEKQWFQWIVEMIMKILQILRIDYMLDGDLGVENKDGKRELLENLRGKKKFKSEAEGILRTVDRHAAMNFEQSFEPERTVSQECQIQCTDEMHLWKLRQVPKTHSKQDSFSSEERVTYQLLEHHRAPTIYQPHRFMLVIQHVKTSNETQLEMGSEYQSEEDMPLQFMEFLTFFQEYVMRIVTKEVGINVAMLSTKFRS